MSYQYTTTSPRTGDKYFFGFMTYGDSVSGAYLKNPYKNNESNLVFHGRDGILLYSAINAAIAEYESTLGE